MQQNTAYQHAQHREKNDTRRDLLDCVLNCTVTYAREQG